MRASPRSPTAPAGARARPSDSSCFLRTEAKTADVDRTVFSRGWADLGNYASDRTGKPLTPGKPYTITLDLAPSDHVAAWATVSR